MFRKKVDRNYPNSQYTEIIAACIRLVAALIEAAIALFSK